MGEDDDVPDRCSRSYAPSVNYYFGSKKRLLHDAAVEALRRWGATTMDAIDPSPEDPGFRPQVCMG